MKLTPTGPSPEQVPFRFPGVTVRLTRWGWIAQKTGAYSAAKRSTLQNQYVKRFSFAGRMASNPVPMEMETAIEMSKGTEQVPRDILTMAALGRYYIIEAPSGLTARYASRPTINDPLCDRAAALYLQTPDLPWQGRYLSIGNGMRLST